MTKKKFILIYTVFSIGFFLLSAASYFGGFSKTIWWFAAMLSGAISSTYCYYSIKGKITEESFVNFIVTIFLLTSFLITLGLSLYEGGQENLPIILSGANAFIWIIYSSFISKKG